MANTPETKEAIKRVFEKLMALSKEEFYAELEKHKDGDIAQILIKSGAIDIIINEWKEKEEKEKNDDM